MKKLNKKGFTLVELLAVIAILSILIIIMVPNIVGLFERGKESTFVTMAQSAYKSAETNFVADQVAPGFTATKTYCYNLDTEASGASSYKLELGGVDVALSYKIVFESGAMTSFVATNGEYSVSLASNPKISDISEATVKETVTITCE